MIGVSPVEQALVDLRLRENGYSAAILASERLEQLGAGDYYLARIRANMLLPEPEWEVLKFVLENFPTNSLIVEIGCGWGQLLAMAAACGYSGVGMDVSSGRLEGGRYLRDLVDGDFPGAAGRLEFLQGDFPSNWDKALECSVAKGRRPVIGFFSNLGIGKSEEFCEACVCELRRFDYVIMDVVRFFADRLDLKVQRAFIEKMEAFGVRYQADIYHRAGAYRFIALAVGDTPPLRSSVVAEETRVEPLIDMLTGRVIPVRSTLEVLTDASALAGLERILRIKEDNTTANGHDIRLMSSSKTAAGLYELTLALRARERRSVCIFLHREWQDCVRIIVNADSGSAFVEQVSGEMFRPAVLKVRKQSDWVQLEAGIHIEGAPEEIGLSIHLVNDAGKYYYDGDGNSTIDVGMLRLSRVCNPLHDR